MKKIDKIWKIISFMPQYRLFKLLKDYNNYVIEITDREDGSIPVCLPEYYQNDWENK